MNANRKWLLHWLLCCFLIGVSFETPAQFGAAKSGNQTSFLLEGNIRLDSLTKYIHRMSAIRISFNSSRLNKSTTIFFPKAQYTADQLLKHIRKHTSLDFTEFRGYYVFADKIKKTGAQKAEAKSGIAPAAGKKTDTKEINSHSPRKSVTSNHQTVKSNSSPAAAEKVILPTLVTLRFVPEKEHAVISVSDYIVKTTITPSSPPMIVQQKKPPGPSANGSTSSLSGKYRKRFSFSFPNLLPDLSGFSWGLQWNTDLPLYGTQNYFGTDNKAILKQLAPGIYAGKQWNDRHELLLQANLFSRYFTGNKTITEPGEIKPGEDTSRTSKTTTLFFTSGSTIALQYNNRFGSAWSAGIGAQYHFTNTVLTRTDNSATDQKRSSSAYGKYFRPGFITAKIELAYQLNKVQFGLSGMLPVTPVAEVDDKKIRPLNIQLILRWRIFDQK